MNKSSIKTVKKLTYFIMALTLGVTVEGQSDTFTTGNLNAIIPDGDLSGIQDSLTLNGLQLAPATITVSLTISGGFNGDYYAYVSHNNRLAVLLNRVGRSVAQAPGYPDAGFGTDPSQNLFTLDDQASGDVHWYQNGSYLLNANDQLTGRWQPDGRLLDPLAPAATFDTAARANELGVFDGMDPNGVWTLFVADVSPGFEGTLVNWVLNIQVVPEPSSAALFLCGFGLLWKMNKRPGRLETKLEAAQWVRAT